MVKTLFHLSQISSNFNKISFEDVISFDICKGGNLDDKSSYILNNFNTLNCSVKLTKPFGISIFICILFPK